MFILSDDILERLLCSQCQKYLSVKPIKVYPNRGIKCGRCSSNEDAGVISLYDIIAAEGLYRCVNRYDGCNMLLHFSDVAEHEKSCTGGIYDCPLCVDFHGSGYYILQHYRSAHNDKFLESPEFLVELDNEFFDVYLYKRNDFLFFISVKFSISENELTVMIEYVGPTEKAKKVEHAMTVHSLDGPIKKKSKKTVCSAIAEQDPKMFKFNLQLDEFAKMIAICRFTLNTEAIDNPLSVPDMTSKFTFGKQIPPAKTTTASVTAPVFGSVNPTTSNVGSNGLLFDILSLKKETTTVSFSAGSTTAATTFTFGKPLSSTSSVSSTVASSVSSSAVFQPATTSARTFGDLFTPARTSKNPLAPPNSNWGNNFNSVANISSRSQGTASKTSSVAPSRFTENTKPTFGWNNTFGGKK